MNTIPEISLFASVVVAITAFVFGFSVYFSNRKSITNRIYLAFSITTATWGLANYFPYKINFDWHIWIIRIIIALATVHAFLLYQLFLVFPHEKYSFSKINKYVLTTLTFAVILLCFTPLVFRVNGWKDGLPTIVSGKGVYFFILLTLYLPIAAFTKLIKKLRRAKNVEEKRPLVIILIGASISYSLILTLNLILPAVFYRTEFVPFSALFVFPSVAFMAYAILKHKMLNVRSIGAILLVFTLLTSSGLEVILSSTTREFVLRGIVFLPAIFLSVYLIRMIVREREQHDTIVRLDKIKSEFTSLATHHILSPLTAVKGYTSLLDEEVGNNTESKKIIASLQHATDSTIQIVRDFLDISKIENKEISYSFEKIDFSEIVAKAIGLHESEFEAKNIYIDFEYPKIDTPINADKIKLTSAISNIFENSLRYFSNGTISVRISSKNSSYVLRISDNAERNLPILSDTLSKKFTNSDNTSEARAMGHGLGLFVAKHTIEAHSGTFFICNNNEVWNFTITLPTRKTT